MERNYIGDHQHHYPGNTTKGMYVFHKPTDHDLWAAMKADYKKKKGGNIDAKVPNLTTPAASTLNPHTATKLSLAKSLQEALTTAAGLSKDQFYKIWDECCNDLGN
jgi:hypothetical protein